VKRLHHRGKLGLINVNVIILIRIRGEKNDGVSFMLSIIIFSFVRVTTGAYK